MKNNMLYIALIVVVNYGFTIVPLVPTPWGEMFPPMSLLVGFVFVARDFAQREAGHLVLLSMLAGGVLSWFMAGPYVAVASVVAFAISETIDWVVYTLSKKPLSQRIVLSSLASTPIDSTVFLAMIGHLSFAGVLAMTIAKIIGALIVARAVK